MKPILFDFLMPIITPRLFIRPPEIGNGAALNAAVLESIYNLQRFVDWATVPPTLEQSETWIRQAAANWILKKSEEPWLPLSIFDKNTQQFIGGTGFHHSFWDVPCVKMVYWIRTSCAG